MPCGKKQTALFEGPMLFASDSNGKYNLDGVDYEEFLKSGFIVSRCGSLDMKDIIGHPESIERREDHLHLRCRANLPPVEGFGFALAGVITERGEDGAILGVEVRSVAIVEASRLTDPRCVCGVVRE